MCRAVACDFLTLKSIFLNFSKSRSTGVRVHQIPLRMDEAFFVALFCGATGAATRCRSSLLHKINCSKRNWSWGAVFLYAPVLKLYFKRIWDVKKFEKKLRTCISTFYGLTKSFFSTQSTENVCFAWNLTYQHRMQKRSR